MTAKRGDTEPRRSKKALEEDIWLQKSGNLVGKVLRRETPFVPKKVTGGHTASFVHKGGKRGE